MTARASAPIRAPRLVISGWPPNNATAMNLVAYGAAVGAYKQGGQVSQVPVAPWRIVALRLAGIMMAAGRQRGYHFPILFLGIATGILVQVKAVQAGWQSLARWPRPFPWHRPFACARPNRQPHFQHRIASQRA